MFLELRRYIVHPVHRDAWVKIMEEKIFPFIMPKGMVVLGSFTALNDSSQYVWLRSFRNDQERVRLYKAVYESEYWGKEIIPSADKMLEWEGIKNVRAVSLRHPDGDLFIDYQFKTGDLLEIKKFQCHPGQLKAWLEVCDSRLIPWLQERGHQVLDSFELPEFPDTHLLMFRCPTPASLAEVNRALDDELAPWLHDLVAEVGVEVPTLVSTDPRHYLL